MQNLLDYLEWRGDLSFARDCFNEVDNLIFSVLAYLDFEEIVPGGTDGGSIPLLEAAEQLRNTKDKPSSVITKSFFAQLPTLLVKAAQSTRYRDIKLSNFVNQVDYERSEQFSAVVFSMSDELHFLAFRGTDDTLAGWKEDLQMSFMDEVQAQKLAAIYLKSVIASLPGSFYLGGHSKGGNLAVFAASQASEEMRDRILGIYNNDGPGFQTNIIQSAGYQSILGKINTLIPRSSVVGMLLEHIEDYKVVGSYETGIMQHNAFSWKVKGANFVYEEGLSKSSLNINTAVRAWLDQLPFEQRAIFVEALFEILQATGARTVRELSQEMLASSNAMIKTYKNLDPQTQSHLKNVIEIFFAESQKALRRSISKEFNLLISKRMPRKK